MAKKISLEHKFPSTPEKVIETVLDTELQKKMYKELGYQEWTEERKEGEKRERTVRVVPPIVLPGFIRKALGDNTGYRERQTWAADDRSYTWDVTFDLTGRAEFRGLCTFEADGDKGCIRRINGEVRAKIPLVGKGLEAYIAGETEKAENRSAGWMARYLGK